MKKSGLNFPSVKEVSTLKNSKMGQLNNFSKIKSKFFKNKGLSSDYVAETSVKDSSKEVGITNKNFAEEAKKAKVNTY